MYVKLEELFSYRQYDDAPIEYYFDRKRYAIVDRSAVLHSSQEHYERYVPLYQINEQELQEDYIVHWNNKKLLFDYRHRSVCFEAFLQERALWNDWWEYYVKRVRQIAIDWCKENRISYK